MRTNICRVLCVLFVLGWLLVVVRLMDFKPTLRYTPTVPLVVLVGGDEHMTILRSGNFVVAAFVDGELCYGTHEPRETNCKQSVPKPEIL